MNSSLAPLSNLIPNQNGSNYVNTANPQFLDNSQNLENYENYILDIAIKKSQEQEKLELLKDQEEELFQLALYNSILEMNTKKEETEKEKKEENTIKLKEEEKEEEKFDEDFGICPIKLEYMKHPMLAPSGNYYEKSAIIGWIKKNQTDPLTREKLTVDMLVEDKEYAKKIKEYKKKFRKQIRKLNK